MAVTVGVVSVAAGAYSAKKQRDIGKRALKGGEATQAKQDYYNDLLMNLLKDPASIKQDPGYQFSFNEGLQAVERSNAARGLVGAGQTSVDLLRYGEEFSSKFLQQRENLLAGLSGAGAASSPAQSFGVAAQAGGSATDILSSTLASLGYTYGKGGFGRTSTAGSPAADAFNQSINISNAVAASNR